MMKLTKVFWLHLITIQTCFGWDSLPSNLKCCFRTVSMPQLMIGSEVFQCFDHFTWLVGLVSPNGLVSDKISLRFHKDQLVLVNSCHMCCRRNVCLPTKGRVYCTAVHYVLLYRCERWALRIDDILGLPVFDHKRIWRVIRTFMDHGVGSLQVRDRVLGKDGESIDEV